MNIQLNYHHLRYFLAVASEGGVKAAADMLHVSPPTLSAQVREMEEFLEVRLFHREGRKMLLTEAGRLVQGYAERIFALGDEMLEAVRRGSPGGPETVFVGISDSVPKLVAARLLGRAWEEMPGLRVVVREGLPTDLFPALAAHQLDLVLANEPAPSTLKPLLQSTRTAQLGVRFAAAPALARTFEKRAGLSGFPVLVPARESVLRRELERWWADAGIAPEIRAEFDDTAAMYELAAAGVGAAPVFESVIDEVGARYGLALLPIETGIYEELYVITTERQFALAGPSLIARLAREMETKVKRGGGRKARAKA